MEKLILKAASDCLGMQGVSVREVPGGFLSRAFVVELRDGIGSQKTVFVRTKKNAAPGSYDAIDQRDSFFRSHIAGVSVEGHPKSLFLSDITTDAGHSLTIHGQEYRPADGSFDYGSIVGANQLDESQREAIRDIARAIAKIHLSPLPQEDSTTDAYERGVLEILINPELTFPTLAHFPSDHLFFGHVETKYAYLSKMQREADRQIAQKTHRQPRRIHGDFWHSNILFDSKGCYFIDFSRTPVGEAGIDVGWFLGNLALDAYLTGKGGPAEAFETFVQTYVQETGDIEILKNSILPVFWIAIIRIFPPVYGNPEDGWAKAWKIVEFVDSCYRNEELHIPASNR